MTRFYQESHSGWTTRPSAVGGMICGGYDIVDASGWALATLAYDYRYTSNGTNHFRANLLANAPELFEYVKSSASAGCATAQALVDRVQRR